MSVNNKDRENKESFGWLKSKVRFTMMTVSKPHPDTRSADKAREGLVVGDSW